MRSAVVLGSLMLIAAASALVLDEAHAEEDVGIEDLGVEPADVGPLEEDATGPGGDVDPGPRLPNGEPMPPRDLVSDAGGCSCRVAAAAWSPAPLVLAGALAVALAKRRR